MGKGRYVFAAPGLVEWEALIPAKRNVIKVHFTGGSLTGYGTRAAVYRTDNEVVAHFIRESAQFKSGRIVEMS